MCCCMHVLKKLQKKKNTSKQISTFGKLIKLNKRLDFHIFGIGVYRRSRIQDFHDHHKHLTQANMY